MSYMGMNILEYIDWLMDQGMSEEDAEREASAAFGLYEEEDSGLWETGEASLRRSVRWNGTRSLESTTESSA